jgi:hypothetical protein
MARAGKKSCQNSWQNSWYAPCSAKSSGRVNFTATVQTQLFKPTWSNHCRPKRLKPEQQTQMVRLQCVRTKKFYRSATTRLTETYRRRHRGDEPEMKL